MKSLFDDPERAPLVPDPKNAEKTHGDSIVPGVPDQTRGTGPAVWDAPDDLPPEPEGDDDAGGQEAPDSDGVKP